MVYWLVDFMQYLKFMILSFYDYFRKNFRNRIDLLVTIALLILPVGCEIGHHKDIRCNVLKFEAKYLISLNA